MSDVQPPTDPKSPVGEVPVDYSETYQRAYRHSLAAHPTELMSPARPGKRASEQSGLGAQRAHVAARLAGVLADPRGRVLLGFAIFVVLVLVAYCAGRIIA